jgi:ribonuclease HI
MPDAQVLTIHTDGAARGNPGPASFAYVITRPGQPAIEEYGGLGDTTNNIAEYTALVKALERAAQLGGRRVHIYSDSELMIKQMLGKYKVKNPGLKSLYEEANQLRGQFESVGFSHIAREQNRRADELCNLALDGAPKDACKHAPNAAPHSSSAKSSGHRKAIALPASAREEILECLRAVACTWAAGNPNHPRPEDVWDQIWTIVEEAGVLRTSQR